MSIVSSLIKKPSTVPLPIYPGIAAGDILPASVLLFYGGPWITEAVGIRLYGHKYKPPAFHAALYCRDGLFLNVGTFRRIEPIEKQFRSTRRIDVLTYRGLTSEMRDRIARAAFLDTSKMKGFVTLLDYSWKDFLRFGLRWLKPSRKDFCSENVVRHFNAESFQISLHDAVNTAPWDLLEWAEANSALAEINTLWIGKDYKG